MTRLIIVNYEGERFVTGNLENMKNNFFKDSGLYPDEILDQKDKEFLFNFFQNYNHKTDKLIIHVKSHGFDTGICELHPELENIGNKETLITWKELISLFNNISEKCNHLIVNLGNVCNSIRIKDCDIFMNFDCLVTNRTVSNSVKPRKINKELLSNIDNVCLDNEYEIIRKT